MKHSKKNDEGDRRSWAKKDDVFMLFRSGVSIAGISERLSLDIKSVIHVLEHSSLARQLVSRY